MSHCINRQEIIDVLFIGQGEPMQSAVSKDMPELYDEEMYTMYTEYDPELAAEYFAEAGITEKGSDGFYLGPDGEPLSFVVQTTQAFGHNDRAEMVVNQWQECGINAQLSVLDRALLYTRKDTNEHDVHVWGAGAGQTIFVDPRHMFPFSAESTFAQAWQTWYNNPSGQGALTAPEEPPADVQRQMELYDQIKATGDYEEQLELMREIIEIAKDRFYVIGLSSSPPGYGIVKNNFHNVPESMPGSWQYPTPAPTNPEQYWIEE
jgi:peptide/nickel transport system substrate-binding protein